MIVSSAKDYFDPSSSFVLALLFGASMAVCLAFPRLLCVLPLLVTLGAAGFFYAKNQFKPVMDAHVLALIGLAMAIAGISCLWSPEPAYSLSKVLKTAPLLLAGYGMVVLCARVRLTSDQARFYFRFLLAIFIFCCLFFFVEYRWHHPILRYIIVDVSGGTVPHSIENEFLLNRGAVFLSLFAYPLFAFSQMIATTKAQKYQVAFIIGAGLFLALFWAQSQSAQIATVVMTIMLLFPAARKTARRVFMGVLLCGIIVAPLIPPALQSVLQSHYGSPDDENFIQSASIPERLEVWNFVAENIAKKPILGHGVEATRFLKSDHIMPEFGTNTVIHPHNAILQVWLEMGVLGVMLALLFVILMFRRMGASDPREQKDYLALFAGIFCVLCIGYGLWQAWLLGMMFTTTAFMAMVASIRKGLSPHH